MRSAHEGSGALAEALRAHGGTVAGLVRPASRMVPGGEDPEGFTAHGPQAPGGDGPEGFTAHGPQAPGGDGPEGFTAHGPQAPGGDGPEGFAPDGPQAPGPPQIAAAGPRAAGREAEYELLFEMIWEGALLHYGAPRVVRTEDLDLALLVGDQLYALGLSRLAELGDLEAVGELADVISLVAQAQADNDAALADAVWAAGAAAVGWGRSEQHSAAKALARAGDPAARGALLASSARGVARDGRFDV